MLVAEGAEQFAVKRGIRLCDPEDLIVDREFAIYQNLIRIYDESKDTGATPPPGEKNAHISVGGWPAPDIDRPGDTVGCVAIDSNGWVVAGTSTGGTGHKLVGRVGDAPLLGGGLYAMNELGGCSTTGWGESIMRILLAKTAVDYLAEDCHPQIAADRAIQRLADRGRGTGGCILLDRHGRIGWAFNTPRMAHAWRTADGRDGDGV
jgi:beta-aspartyl-peptidase (threonine type)